MRRDHEPKRHDGEAEAKLLRDARKAAIGTHVAQLRALYRLKQGLENTDCDGAPATAPAPGCESPDAQDERSLSEAIFDLARLQLDTYNSLLQIGANHGDRLAQSFRDRLRNRRRVAVAPGEVLELTGPYNSETDAVVFCVVNRLRCAATIDFRVGEFSDLGSNPGPPFSRVPEFHAQPPLPDPKHELCLASGESRFFAMRLSLADPFISNHVYAANFRVCLDGNVLEQRLIRVTVQ